MQTVFSDIYDCAACNDALSFPVDAEGEDLHHWPALVCLACSLAYRVDEATGELLPVEDVIGKLRAEVERLTAERDAFQSSAEMAADRANRAQAERDAARRDAEERRLELLAEQGNHGGAPPGWIFEGRRRWQRTCGGLVRRLAPNTRGWEWWIRDELQVLRAEGAAPTARAAMLAADKATL